MSRKTKKGTCLREISPQFTVLLAYAVSLTTPILVCQVGLEPTHIVSLQRPDLPTELLAHVLEHPPGFEPGIIRFHFFKLIPSALPD